MSKQKMLAARELINEKRYAEARALLKTINDPKAQEWLKKLDQIAPEKKKSDGKLIFIAVALVAIALIVIAGLLIVRQNNENTTNQNAVVAVPTQMELPNTPTTFTDTATEQVVADPEVMEAVTIHCMSVAQLSRQECEDFAEELVVDPDFTETVTLCTERYADDLDTFGVCMQDVWTELDNRDSNNRLQVLMLYQYCSGLWDTTGDEACFNWANAIGILSPGWSVAEECWRVEDLGDILFEVERGEEQAVQCIASKLGEEFPEQPICDSVHPQRHKCTDSLRDSFVTTSPLASPTRLLFPSITPLSGSTPLPATATDFIFPTLTPIPTDTPIPIPNQNP